jgi:hypothetical protein
MVATGLNPVLNFFPVSSRGVFEIIRANRPASLGRLYDRIASHFGHSRGVTDRGSICQLGQQDGT